MKKFCILYCFLTVLLVFSCTPKQTTVTTNAVESKFNEKSFDPIFKGLGTEPFWNISISDDFIVYKDIDGTIETFPISSINKAQDANVLLVRSISDKTQVDVKIVKQACSDGMSDNEFEYKVNLSILKNSEELTLSGCGNYIIPLKLHGKWTLNYFNDTIIPSDKYLKTPYLEFNSEPKKVTGNASCNGFNGSIFFDHQIMRFSDLAVTRMMCVHETMEPEFLKELKTVTHYKVSDKELKLYTGDQHKMTFVKE